MTHATNAPARRGTEQRGAADISDRNDILELLRDFYGRAFRDELLGPVFVDVARMDLDAHLPVICDFWETVLFHAGSYRRNALAPHQRLHARAVLTPAHFARWLTLWTDTLDERHAGPNAELAKLQGGRMAGAMSRRITGKADLGGAAGDPRAADAAGRNLRSWADAPRPPESPDDHGRRRS
jgi:hemoglobin